MSDEQPPVPPSSADRPDVEPDEPTGVAPQSQADTTPKKRAKTQRPARSPRVRVLTAVGVTALLMLASASAGIAGGWSIANSTLVASQANPRPTVIKIPAYVGVGSVSMPDVRGLSSEDAMQVLADAGIPANIVTSTSKPAAGDVGAVVSQTPTFGTESPTAVQLVLSAGGTMPDVTGQSLAKATSTLNDLGVRIEQTDGYDAEATPNTVLSTTPRAGKSLTSAVTVVLNAPPTSRYLSTLDPVDGGCSTNSDLKMNAVAFPQGLVCSAGSADYPRETSWLLEKAVDSVRGTVGIPDTGDPSDVARVRLIGDGVVLFDSTVRYGATVPVDIRTTGRLRLTLRVTTSSQSYPSAGLGDLQLVGSSTAMSALPED